MLGQGTGTEIMAAILLGHAQSSVACCDKRTTDIESAHEIVCKIKNRNEMNVNPASLAFRTKLLSISNSITQKEFSDLKFVCKEHIPVGILERFTTPLELFNQLEKHNLLAADNKDFLGVLLIGINRNELRDELFDEKGKPSEVDQVLALIKESLCDHYKNVIGWLQPLAWNASFHIHIKHIFTNLEVVTELQQGTVTKREPLKSYCDIFKPRCAKSPQPRRILVEGRAGVGKSTFASKLSYDWASGSDYLSSFKIVCLLELKQIKGSLKEAIFEQLFPRDFALNEDQIFKFLTAHQESTLLILDGYDEISAPLSRDIVDLFSRKLLRNTTVLLTSRPGKVSKIHRFADSRLEIVGFSIDNVHEYINKYFQDDPTSAESLINELEVNPVTEDVAKIPLTAMLLCALWEEMPHAALQSTLSGLFTELTLSLVKRYYTKNLGGDVDFDVDSITGLEEFPKDLMESLLSLGELALNGLFSDKLIFDMKEVEKCCSDKGFLEVGFLSKETSASKLKPIQKCRFLHKSFQEFFAAFWLSSRIKSAFINTEEFEEVSALVMRCLAAEIAGNILFVFVPGLLGDAFGPFLGLLLTEGSMRVNDDETRQGFLQACMSSLFESQQGHLSHLLQSLIPDGVVKANARDVSAYGIRSLVFFLENNPAVRSLVLEHSSIDQRTISVFARALPKLPNLKEIVMNQNMIGYEGVQAFSACLEQNLTLEKLTFNANYTGKESATAFSKILDHCPKLLYLDYSYNSIGDEGMKETFSRLKSLPRLRELRIAGNKLTSKGMVSLCFNLKHVPQLTRLSLGNQLGIGADGIQVLSEGLPLTVPRLQVLNLENCNLFAPNSREASAVVFRSLGKAFEKLQELKSLNLSGNSLSDGTYVGECVQHATGLVHLDLSGNVFGDRGVESLSKSLPNLRVLEELLLDSNRISCDGIVILLDVIKGIHTLRVLSLECNTISDRGVKELAAVLPYLSALEKLLLAYNLITEHGMEELAPSLVALPQLECLSIKGNAIREEGFVCLVSVLAALPNLRKLMVGAPVKNRNESDTKMADSPVDPTVVYGDAQQLAPIASGEFPGDITGDPPTWERFFGRVPERSMCYVRFTRDTFDLLMDAANGHPILQEIYMSQNAIPTGVDVVGSTNYRKLRLWGHYSKS